MWLNLLLIIIGTWLFFQAVVGDLAGRLLSWSPA